MEYIYYLNEDCIECFNLIKFNEYLQILLTTKSMFRKIYYVTNLSSVVDHSKLSHFKALISLSFDKSLIDTKVHEIKICIDRPLIDSKVTP